MVRMYWEIKVKDILCLNEKLENQRIFCDLELEDDSNCKVSFPLTWTYEDFLDEDNLKNIIIEKENGDL